MGSGPGLLSALLGILGYLEQRLPLYTVSYCCQLPFAYYTGQWYGSPVSSDMPHTKNLGSLVGGLGISCVADVNVQNKRVL